MKTDVIKHTQVQYLKLLPSFKMSKGQAKQDEDAECTQD